ncbi:unnamed protein product [Moneuplotes crassus]|uniref:Uncharacterized protein n=1 Tax=Euplotes crassus TaxID=5936 RepID=A0AAD2D6B4_EUPCR|nr:unnamed protein product [Moneuplotes crassus]
MEEIMFCQLNFSCRTYQERIEVYINQKSSFRSLCLLKQSR